MEIASNLALPGYHPQALTSSKNDADIGIAVLKKAIQIQRDAAQQMVQSLQQSPTPASALPDHLGRRINVTA